MTKSLELVIAIIILFSFLFVVTDIYRKPSKSIEINNSVIDLLKLKANEKEFRELVEDKNVTIIHNTLYPFIESEFTIIICDYINTNCINEKEINTINKDAIDYYFSDINKTISIVFWGS
jgi:hypothetical protein